MSWVGRAALPLWCLVLATGLWLLHLSAGYGLERPPLGRPQDLGPWATDVGAAAAVVSVLRLGAIGATWYLIITTAAGVVLRRVGSANVPLLNRATPAPVQRILDGARSAAPVAGLGLVIAPVVIPLPSGQTQTTATAPALTAVEPPMAQLTLIPPRTAPERPPLGEPGPPEAADEHSAESAPALDFELRLDGPTSSAADQWTVEPGDHLWAIAAATLAETWGRAPSETEVAGYWARLVRLNRDRLVDPRCPDLIYPGQILSVPPPAPGPTQPGT